MFPSELLPLIAILATLYLIVVAISYWWMRHTHRQVTKKEEEVRRRLYELAILKEISERTGYSLNLKKILDVIAGSLNQFLSYSTVSYMLLEPSKVTFKVELGESVSPQFIKDVRGRMAGALAALTGRDISTIPVEETVTGALMLEGADKPIRSYFNIPLMVGEDLAGLLTIASVKEGLYKEEEMEILYKIMHQASQAVAKLEEVVQTEQGKSTAMLESMVEGVIMTDRDYRIIAANPAARAIIDYEKQEPPTIFNYIDAFGAEFDIKARLEEAIKLDKMLKTEEILFRGKYYQVLVTPVKANTGVMKGEILGGAIIFHDVTHEKEAEKMRNSFTGMMVHELRAPLGNIKKIGELMRTTNVLENKKESGEYVSMLYESSSAMLDLVNDLLDVARLEAGKFEVEKRPGNIREVINERVKFFSVAAQDAGVRLVPLVADAVPVSILFDQKRIAQALDNFLSNALKYTARSGVVTVVCFLHKKGVPYAQESSALGAPWIGSAEEAGSDTFDSIVIAVTDTGTGISEENIKKMWNKFTQFETSARERDHKGTGLGLVIVKGIVETHGGTVGVGSQIGKGSTFYFTLPFESTLKNGSVLNHSQN